MNYFNYFTEIEDTFVRRRGKHLLLSPMDWALIESWKKMGVPLHIALNGIERAFDSFDSKPRRRTVKSLLYCQEEVEAQYAEWLEGQVGGSEASDDAGDVSQKQPGDSRLPFPRAEILKHLQDSILALQKIGGSRTDTLEGDFSETIYRVVARLEELTTDFSMAAHPDAEKLESSLSSLDQMLEEALRKNISPEEMATISAAASEQLKPYRNRMEPGVFATTADNLLLKHARDIRGVPRLSLFYL